MRTLPWSQGKLPNWVRYSSWAVKDKQVFTRERKVFIHHSSNTSRIPVYQACAGPWGPRGESQSVPVPKEHRVWWGCRTGAGTTTSRWACVAGRQQGVLRESRAELGKADAQRRCRD